MIGQTDRQTEITTEGPDVARGRKKNEKNF